MLLYFVRHGETDWNRTRRLQGRTDTPLNENGIKMAEITAEAMKDIHFDCAFTSPLSRAKKTAQIILEGRNISLTDDDRLKEISFGECEGIRGRDDNAKPIGIFGEFYYHPDSYVPPKGGESVRDVCARTWAFLEDITSRKELQDKSILIATHGAALQSMMLWVKKLPYEDYWKSGLKGNCSVTIVEVKDGRPELLEEGKCFYSVD